MPATVSPDYVYLDYAATAPLCEEALEAMKPYLTCGRDNLALNMNANSLHSPGRAAFEALEAARKSIARDIGASRPSEVIFTSGSTESDDTVLLGCPRRCRSARCGLGSFTPHVIVSDIARGGAHARKAARAAGFRVTPCAPTLAASSLQTRLRKRSIRTRCSCPFRLRTPSSAASSRCASLPPSRTPTARSSTSTRLKLWGRCLLTCANGMSMPHRSPRNKVVARRASARCT